MNELKEALRIFSTIKGQDSALKLLNHFGVTRLSELPEDRRDEPNDAYRADMSS